MDLLDPFDQTPEEDELAALRAGIQMLRCSTVGAWSLDELDALLVGRVVADGPYVREFPDGRRQFYAYVR